MWYISTVENYPFMFSTQISQGEVLLKAFLFFSVSVRKEQIYEIY